MKKNELAKKSRKLLSAILTGTVLITSVVPESLIWAADVEMQEFEDGEDNEDVIFEAAEEPAEEPETEDVEESGEVEIQDLSESQDEDDTEDAVEVEEDFTDGVALFSSGSEMAVGTAAANTISPGEDVTITSGGTYTVQGGTYTKTGPRDPFGGVITIDTTEKVTLEITGDINMPGDDDGCFISIENACKELTIINEYTVNVDNNVFLNNKNKDATVTFEGGTYEGLTDGGVPIIQNGGVVNLKNAKFNATGSFDHGIIVKNGWFDNDGTINIQNGTILDCGGNTGIGEGCIVGGTVNMYGGTITSTSSKKGPITIGINAAKIKVVGGKIQNFAWGIYLEGRTNVSATIGNVTFENNDCDIVMGSGKKFTIQDDFKGTASVNVPSFPCTITTPGTSPEMCKRITYDDGFHSISYDTTEKCLYVSDHLHSWSYSTSADKIIATCTAKPNCEFNPGKLDLTLAAADAYYSGNTYTGATVTNGIAYQSDNEADIVYYLKDGTKTNSSNSGAASEGAAPVNSGQYTVKVTLGGQTISADFEIKKMEIDPTVTMDGWTYGQKANTPSITVKSGESDITDASSYTCTYYTDAGCTDMTTAADGAATNGGVPKNAGTYYVKVVVPENGNYAGAEAETSFMIAPLPADLTWSKTDLIYTGSEQSVSATVANALEGDSFAIAYEGNTQTKAGDSYTATVTNLGNNNYTLTGATGVSQNWSISYLQTSAAAQVSGTKGKNDWYISPVKLVPDSGYQISTNKTDWKDSLGDYTDQGEQSAEYYLKETATGAVTDKKTVTFKIDTGMPSGSIRIGENTFDSSLKDVTYGYWFKDNVSVDITGADSASGIASVEYQAVSAEESYDANGTWLPWNAAEKLSLTEGGRYVVYARVTDNAGNQTTVNSDGVVVFKDSVVVDSSIDYTRTTKASVDAKVTLNGNTVASVRNGETTLTEGKDYTVFEDRITFSGEYLDTLEAGTYKLTVAYHPQGVTEYKGGDKPADSQIAVNVSRQTANVKITGTLDKEYDGQPADLAYTTNSNANIKVEYNVNETWQTEAPIHAGTYEVRVSVSENGDFTDASDTKAYTIRQREVVVSGITAKGKVYDGTADAELDYSKAVFAGAVKGDSLTVSAEGTFADSNAAKGKTVTITKPVLGGGSAGDYILADNGQQTSTTADISPKEITVKITPNGGIYEGTITPATAVLDGLVGEDDPEIILTYAGKANDGTAADGKVPSKAGTYTVTASVKDGNYSLKEDGSSAEFTIKRADPQLSVSAVKDKKYGEEAFKLEVSNKGDGVKSYASSDDKVVTVDNNGVVTIIGTGAATLTVSLAESADYTADQKEVTVAVGKIEHSLVVDKISYKVTYGDPAFKITAKAGDTESGIQFASDNKEVATVSKDGTVNIGNTGTAKITVSMDESQNYLAVSREVTVTVVPKEISAKIAPNGGIYGEIIVPAVAALDGLVGKDNPEITLTYTGRANDGTEVNGTKVPSLAGIYTVTATIKDKNYSLKTEGASAAFIVAKAYPALSVSAVKDKKYGEEAFKLEVSNKGNGVKSYASSNDKVVTADKNGVVTIVGAGTATLTVSLAETANYTADQKEVTITVAPKEITVKITPNGGTYGGTITPATAVLDGLVGKDNPEITLTYTGKANDGTEVNGTEVPSLAGTYIVTATIKDGNYSLKPEGSSAEFVVAKADSTLSVPAVKDKKYGEEAFKLEVSNKGDGVKSYASSNDKVVTVDKKGVVTIVGAGTATLTVSLAQSANYTADQKEVTVTVVPKEITVKITPNGGTYEGTITPATAVLDGLVGKDNPEITLTYTGKANDGTEVNGTEVPSLAGTYIVTATIKDKNYSLKPEGSSAEFVVAKADPALSVSEVTDKDYGEETFRLNVSNKGDGLKTYASSDDKVAAVDENGMVTIVGTGTVTLTVSLAESANYTADQKEVTITVRKLGRSLVIDKLSYKVTYGAPAFKIMAKAKDTESDIRFASDNKKVATVSEDGTVTIRNAGTAKITVSMDESQNYLAVSREVIITVAPKNITVTADNKNKIAGKADPVLTYTAKGLVGKDTLSGITVRRKAGEKVGIYPITVSQASGSNPNYRITFRKGIFTIEQADQSKLSGKDVYRLKLPVFFAAGKAQKNSIVVSWRKYPGAAGYDVFWCYCDGSINYKKAGTVKNGKLSMTHKNLKSNREYKYFVAAYKMVKGRKIYIAKSNEVHVAMKKARTTNAFSIKVNRTTVILKPGKTFRLKCQLTSENRKKKLLSHPSSYRYYTTNSKIATVSQNGVIRAKAKGSCSIYILASNGVYKRVTVKVK
ncbi:MBG domain-containing protein [Blautia obeum]|uniref:MBG domain-containing protein n=1 Tax=Blautia obeum TaxID=40520 RepID=UPI0035691CD9